MRREQGYSLVELMISMALGLIISAAATQLFLANHIATNFQRGMNDVQANGRFMIDQLMEDIRIAGLDNTAVATTAGSGVGTSLIAPIVFTAGDLANLSAGSTAISSDATQTDAGITASDQLVMQYLALEDTVDCEGNAVAKDRYVVARYFVREDASNDNVPSLACDGSSHNGSTLATATAPSTAGYDDNGVVLVSGVDSFQILYGIDDGTNGLAQVNRYVNAATYNALSPKPPVLAVRLGLYLRSQERAGDAQPPTNAVQVLDTSIPAANIPDDGLLRRLFVTTVTLRNVDLSRI